MLHLSRRTAPPFAAVLLALISSLTTAPVEAFSRRGTIDVRWKDGTACFGLPPEELSRLKRVVSLHNVSVFDLTRSRVIPSWEDSYPALQPRLLDPDGCLLYGDAQGAAATKRLTPLRIGVPYEVYMNIETIDHTQFHLARFCLRRQLDGSTGLITLKHVGDKGWNTWACGAP